MVPSPFTVACALALATLVPIDCWGVEPITINQAERLVRAVPDYREAVRKNKCPAAELLWADEISAAFQVRSRCKTTGSGLIGIYVVDRQTAAIRLGVDRDQLVTSPSLVKLQQEILRTRMQP